MQPTKLKYSGRYMLQLDSLRAFSALGVLIHHFCQESEFVSFGYYGVKLFFVLSGFLITAILLDYRNRIEQTGQSGTSAIAQFYLRRTLRIAPIYYGILLMALLLGNMDVLSGAWWYATYTANFFFIKIGFYPLTTAHLWSLSVDAQFYLLWPFVIFFLTKRHILTVIVVLILVGPLCRLFAIMGSYGGLTFYTFTLSSIDSLGWGALLAWLVRNERETYWLKRAGLGIFLLLPIVTPILVEETYFHVLENTFISVALVWLIASAAKGFGGPIGAIMNWKPLVYIGQISYGVYLYHLFIPWGLYEVLGLTRPETPAVNAIILVTTTILVASLSWHFLEKPISGLKKHFPSPGLIPKP